MSKFYQGKKFLKEQEKWYKRLKLKAFDDIEIFRKTVPDGSYIKRDQGSIARRFNGSTEEYYRRCRIHFQHHKFKNARAKWLFAWHSDGHSYREVVKLYNKRFRCKRSIFFIWTKTKELLLEMRECSYWLQTDSPELSMLEELTPRLEDV